MGYDMTIIGGVPPTDPAVVAAAEKAVDALHDLGAVKRSHGYLNAPLQHDIHRQIVEPVLVHWSQLKAPETFRLNMWAMPRFVDAMIDADMAHPSTSPITPEEWETLPDPDEDWDAFLRAQDRLTAKHVTQDPTIPSHKFSSNDGWCVTPTEISHALRAWERYSEKVTPVLRPKVMQLTRWELWIEYLRLAENNGGIRVS